MVDAFDGAREFVTGIPEWFDLGGPPSSTASRWRGWSESGDGGNGRQRAVGLGVTLNSRSGER